MKEMATERMISLIDSYFVHLYRQAIEGNLRAEDTLRVAKSFGFKRARELDGLLHSFPEEEIHPNRSDQELMAKGL